MGRIPIKPDLFSAAGGRSPRQKVSAMIVHVNITEQIIAYMKEQIASGAWKPGEKIPSENQLTKELGVSRASVRDAIKYFIGQGVLESFHGKGTFLLEKSAEEETDAETTITAEDCENVEAVLEYRRIIESEACYMAAKNMDEEVLALLRYQYEEMLRCVDDRTPFLVADLAFHRIIARASGNPLVSKSMNLIFQESFDVINRMYDLFSHENGIRFHEKILRALEKRDAAAARKAMYDHMQSSIERLHEKKII